MSILLEALKRAEEEKKAINRLESAEESAQRAARDASISPEDLTSLIARGSKKGGARAQDASQAEVRRSSDALSLSTASETTDLEASLSQASSEDAQEKTLTETQEPQTAETVGLSLDESQAAVGTQEAASQSVDADEGAQASQAPISLTLTDSSFESETTEETPQAGQSVDDHEAHEPLATLSLSEMQPEQATDAEAMETSAAETEADVEALSSALTLQEVETPISSEKQDRKQENRQENRQEKTQDEKRASEDKTAEAEEAEEEVSSLMEEVIALASSDALLGSETQASSPNSKGSEKEGATASENALEKALKEAPSVSEQAATESAMTAEEKGAASSTDTPSADATSKAEADKSFDWSLKQIPGFQSSKNKKSTEKTPDEAARKRSKSFLSLFSSSKKKRVVKKPHRSYRGVLVFLMMLLVIVMGASYWGMGYYQQLAQQNLQEEVRYQRQLRPVQMAFMAPPHSEGVEEETPALVHDKPAMKETLKREGAKVKAASSPQRGHKAPPKKEIKKRIKPVRQTVPPHKAAPAQRAPEMSVQTVKVEDPRERAFAALERGDYAQAQADYQKAATLFPKDPQVWMGLGASSLQLGETEKARAYYQRALKLDPDNKAAQKAVLMLSPEHDRKWLSRLERLLVQTPRDPDLYFLKGQYYIQNQDWFLARKALEKAVQLNPRFLEAILNLAIAEDHLGRYKEAFTHYRQALALAGNHLSDERKNMIANRVLELAKYVVQ